MFDGGEGVFVDRAVLVAMYRVAVERLRSGRGRRRGLIRDCIYFDGVGGS